MDKCLQNLHTQTGNHSFGKELMQSFRGGMFVDGFAGNVETRIVGELANASN